MLKWIKENKIILITMLIFETVAVSLFISTKNLFSNKYSNSCIPGARFFKSTLYNLNFPKAF